MAKKLNKKLVFIGSALFVVFALVSIFIMLSLSKDPAKYIELAETAWADKNYEEAGKNFSNAVSNIKEDSAKVELLYTMVDMFYEAGDWNSIRGCWERISKIEPENVEVRLGLLSYLYVAADSGGYVSIWKEIEKQSSELLSILEKTDQLDKDMKSWELFDELQYDFARQSGAYVHMVKGRSVLELVRFGAVDDQLASLEEAEGDLKKFQEMEPENRNSYKYLAQAIMTRGNLLSTTSGRDEESDAAMQSAIKELEKGVEACSDDPVAYVHLMELKIAAFKGDLAELAPEIDSLVDRFASESKVHALISQYNLSLGYDHIADAIKATAKAAQLDPLNIDYALHQAVLHYRKFSIEQASGKGSPSDVYAAIDIARKAMDQLEPDPLTGPLSYKKKNWRISLYTFLAKCYTDQLLEPCEEMSDQQREEFLTNAKEMVYQIGQFHDSGDHEEVIKWKGMLDFALGNKREAAKKLNIVYERLKADGRKDVDVCYALTKLYEDSSEIGAVKEFMETALDTKKFRPNVSIAQSRPKSILNYAEIMLKLNAWGYVQSNVEVFEKRFGSSDASRSLLVKANIGAKQFEEAEKIIAQLDQNASATLSLYVDLLQAKIDKHTQDIAQAEKNSETSEPVDSERRKELNHYKEELGKLTARLLDMDPEKVTPAVLARVFTAYADSKEVGKAQELADKYLSHFPDNTTVLFYREALSEPDVDLNNLSQEKRQEIENRVLSNLSDISLRAVNLGAFYKRTGQLEEAKAELKKNFDYDNIWSQLKGVSLPDVPEELEETSKIAGQYLFDLAIELEQYDIAERIANIGKYRDLDDCKGHFLKARLNIAQKDYKNALLNLDLCLSEKPVFSYAYMLKSNIYSAQNNSQLAIENAKKAAQLNPMDGRIAKVLVEVLYQELGANPRQEELVGFKSVLDRAMALNRNDVQLMSFYAEFIYEQNPVQAMAIRNGLFASYPTFENALLLGKMALRRAKEIADPTEKQALLETTAAYLEEARKLEPQSDDLLATFTDYFKFTGRESDAVELIKNSQDKNMLYNYYMGQGSYSEAREVMMELYNKDKTDPVAVKGLLLAAEKLSDVESFQKYSGELLAIENTEENKLYQIQTFLKLGLVSQAQLKIESFKEKHPEDSRVLLLEAWLAMKQGSLEKALDITNQILEGDLENSMAWRLRGEIHYLTADYAQALNDLLRSNNISDQASTKVMLSSVYARMHRDEDALRELEIANRLADASPEIRLQLEQLYKRMGKVDSLKTFYAETLKKFKDSMFWYNQAGSFYLSMKDHAIAEKLFSEAWNGGKNGSKKDMENALNGYLQMLLINGKINEAFDEAQKHVDGDFASIAYITIAEAKSKTSDKAAVLEYCQKAIDKSDQSQALRTWVLRKMYDLVGTEDMMKYCEQRLTSEPDSLIFNYIMFDLLRVQAQFNKALSYIDKCVAIVGSDSDEAESYAISKVMVLQLAYDRTNDSSYLKQAISSYESLLKKTPSNVNMLNNLAYLLAENDERLDDALEFAEQAYQASPNNANFLDTYSYVLYKNGKYEDAQKYLLAAQQQYGVENVPVPSHVYEHMGMLQEKLGKKDEAAKAYKQALEAGKGSLPQSAIDRINNVINRL